jgi:hypothetical protein
MKLVYRILILCLNFKARSVVKHERWRGSRHISGVDEIGWCALAKWPWKIQTYATRLVSA